MLQDFVDLVRERTGLDAVFAALSRPEADGYVIDRTSGDNLEPYIGTRVNTGLGLGGKAFLLGKPSRVVDYRTATTISHEYDYLVERTRLGPMVAVPIMSRGRATGVVYGGLRSAQPIGDRVVATMCDLNRRFEYERRIADEVAQTVSPIVAECRAIAALVQDPDLRERLLNVAGGGTEPALELTPRERDVVTCIGEGLSNAAIAAELGLRENTVKAYVRSAMRKAGVHNRVALVNRVRG